MEDLVFLAAGILSFVSACAIVSRRNPVYAVVGMVPFFLGQAVILVLLSASFLAAMQVMVYGGAILVVFLFVIMLISLRPEELKVDFTGFGYLAAAVLAGLLGAFLLVFVLQGIPAGGEWEQAFGRPLAQSGAAMLRAPTAPPYPPLPRGGEPEFGSVGNLSLPLFQDYLVPFELVSLLLLVALVGVVFLGKKRL